MKLQRRHRLIIGRSLEFFSGAPVVLGGARLVGEILDRLRTGALLHLSDIALPAVVVLGGVAIYAAGRRLTRSR